MITAYAPQISVDANAPVILVGAYIDYTSRNPYLLDQVLLTDATTFDVTTTAADTATLTDQPSLGFGMVQTDSIVSPTDAAVFAVGMGKSDTLSATDSAAFALGTNYVDTVTSSDSFVAAYAAVKADTLTATSAATWFKQDYVAVNYFAADYIANATGSF